MRLRRSAGRSSRARAAIAIMFFCDGAIFGTWVSRVPAIAAHVHAKPGGLGLALLGIAAGALLSRQVAGQLVVRIGSRAVIRVGIASCCVMLPLPVLAASITVLGIALIGFGAALGILDVAINVNGVAVQDQIKRPGLRARGRLRRRLGSLGLLSGGSGLGHHVG